MHYWAPRVKLTASGPQSLASILLRSRSRCASVWAVGLHIISRWSGSSARVGRSAPDSMTSIALSEVAEEEEDEEEDEEEELA